MNKRIKILIVSIISILSLNLALANKEPFLERELKPDFLPSVTNVGESKNEAQRSEANATTKTRLFVGDIIVNSLQILGAAMVFLIILYGFKMVIAFGDEEQIAESKRALGYLIAGFLLVMLSYSITNFILEFTLIPQEIQESNTRPAQPTS